MPGNAIACVLQSAFWSCPTDACSVLWQYFQTNESLFKRFIYKLNYASYIKEFKKC